MLSRSQEAVKQATAKGLDPFDLRQVGIPAAAITARTHATPWQIVSQIRTPEGFGNIAAYVTGSIDKDKIYTETGRATSALSNVTYSQRAQGFAKMWAYANSQAKAQVDPKKAAEWTRFADKALLQVERYLQMKYNIKVKSNQNLKVGANYRSELRYMLRHPFPKQRGEVDPNREVFNPNKLTITEGGN